MIESNSGTAKGHKLKAQKEWILGLHGQDKNTFNMISQDIYDSNFLIYIVVQEPLG